MAALLNLDEDFKERRLALNRFSFWPLLKTLKGDLSGRVCVSNKNENLKIKNKELKHCF